MEQQPETAFQLSGSDEEIVRTYACTKLRRLLSPTTTGYLTITNKRIVFHSIGKSLTGKSLLINEMPLEDVAGVNSYLGVSINWFFFIAFGLVLYFLSQFLTSFLPPFLTSWVLGVLLMLPYIALWFLTSSFIADDARQRMFRSIDELFKNKVETSKALPHYLPLTRLLFFIGLAILGWAVANYLPFLNLVTLIVIYFFIYLYFFHRYKTFSLVISSKTMKGSGIFISGETFRIFSGRDNTAFDALSASPAADAELVTRELGALLLDMRLLGDLGIQKWKQQIAH